MIQFLKQQQQERLLEYAQDHGYTDISPRYVSCRIELYLTQPLAGYDPIHLDGLLSSAIVLDALQGVPLERSSTPYTIPLPLEVIWRSQDGLPLYHCSSLLPVGAVKKSLFTWTKKNDPSISYFATHKKDGTEWQPDNGSGQNREYCQPLQLKSAPHLVAYAVGDMDEIHRLLPMLPSIGKKTAWGFGRVADITLKPCDLEDHYCFIRDKTLLRPTPVGACQDLGFFVSGDTQLIGYTPPYWLPVNQTNCHTEMQQVSRDLSSMPQLELLSIPEFLHRCYVADSMWNNRPGGTTLLHSKYEQGKGVGEPCAITGLPIIDGAVPSKFAISENMGNVVDFCHAPNSRWVSNTAAIILSQPKQMHRNLVALIHPTDKADAHLLWPSIAVDPTNPKQARPLWREVFLALSERYQGYRCILIFKDEPKSRTWPYARIGMIGEQTPLLFSDSKFGIEAILQISIPEAIRQMLYIEELLDAGYGKMEIRHGLKSPSIEKLIETLEIEKKLSAIRNTPEFPFVWHIARTQEDRVIRKDIQLELS